MTRGQDGLWGNVQALEGAESKFAAALAATSEEMAYSECLDVEERSEVYTILEAILADTEAHRRTIKLLASRLAEGGADA